jgi:hypothetical protein
LTADDENFLSAFCVGCVFSRVLTKKARQSHALRALGWVKSAENVGLPPKALMSAIAKLGEEATRAGAMVETGGLLPSAMGARVRLTAGKLIATDGPFAESKELIGGYAVYDVKSKNEAIEWASRFMQLHVEHWPGWEGACEIRQIFDGASGAQGR